MHLPSSSTYHRHTDDYKQTSSITYQHIVSSFLKVLLLICRALPLAQQNHFDILCVDSCKVGDCDTHFFSHGFFMESMFQNSTRPCVFTTWGLHCDVVCALLWPMANVAFQFRFCWFSLYYSLLHPLPKPQAKVSQTKSSGRMTPVGQLGRKNSDRAARGYPTTPVDAAESVMAEWSQGGWMVKIGDPENWSRNPS